MPTLLHVDGQPLFRATFGGLRRPTRAGFPGECRKRRRRVPQGPYIDIAIASEEESTEVCLAATATKTAISPAMKAITVNAAARDARSEGEALNR